MITYGLFLYLILTASVVFIGSGIDTVRGRAADLTTPYTSGLTVRNRILAASVYVLLSGVSLCRIAVGNDYWVYRDNFNLIAQDRYVSYEPGFRYIVKILQWFLRYDDYLPIFAFFSLITVALMVKGIYDQSEWFVFSLFIFMTAGYYFGSLNNVRYYLALSAAMYSIKYVLKKDYIAFFAVIIAAAFFHKSVLIVIPLYLLATVNWNWVGHFLISLFSASLISFRDFTAGSSSFFIRSMKDPCSIPVQRASPILPRRRQFLSLHLSTAGKYLMIRSLNSDSTVTSGRCCFIPSVRSCLRYPVSVSILI